MSATTTSEQRIKELEEELAKAKSALEMIEEAENRGKEFEFDPNKPLLLVKMGNKTNGWIPSKSHYTAFHKYLTAMGVHKHYNIILWNYAIEIEKHDFRLNA